MPPDDAPLIAALERSRAHGAIGEASVTVGIAHADRFVGALGAAGVASGRLADLGSGGGLPALVIAWRCPGVHVTMIERRATRADLLRRAVTALGLGDRAEVVSGDVSEVIASQPHSFDVVTARSFGPPDVTAAAAAALLVPGGSLFVSEPPQGREWVHLDAHGLHDGGCLDGIRRLRAQP